MATGVVVVASDAAALLYVVGQRACLDHHTASQRTYVAEYICVQTGFFYLEPLHYMVWQPPSQVSRRHCRWFAANYACHSWPRARERSLLRAAAVHNTTYILVARTRYFILCVLRTCCFELSQSLCYMLRMYYVTPGLCTKKAMDSTVGSLDAFVPLFCKIPLQTNMSRDTSFFPPFARGEGSRLRRRSGRSPARRTAALSLPASFSVARKQPSKTHGKLPAGPKALPKLHLHTCLGTSVHDSIPTYLGGPAAQWRLCAIRTRLIDSDIR